jgi:hypothetical protein
MTPYMATTDLSVVIEVGTVIFSFASGSNDKFGWWLFYSFLEVNEASSTASRDMSSNLAFFFTRDTSLT